MGGVGRGCKLNMCAGSLGAENHPALVGQSNVLEYDYCNYAARITNAMTMTTPKYSQSLKALGRPCSRLSAQHPPWIVLAKRPSGGLFQKVMFAEIFCITCCKAR